MSLLPPRKSRPLGRQHRRQRDDARFVVATEDTYAPKQYFAAFQLPRVSVEVVETNDGRSAASHVVARLKKVHDEAKRNNELQENDQFWVLLDTDHWTQPNHVALSNPCFELWLLLHVADALPAINVEEQLRAALGAYSRRTCLLNT